MRALKKRSEGSIGKNQPVNINISFNINPKSIISSQGPSEMKISHSLYPPNSKIAHQKGVKVKDDTTEMITKKSSKRTL